MVKHWPGGGTGEGGRDAHYPFGCFAVYPSGAFEEHLRPFTEGAFHLNGPTGKAGAVMPYYTVSYGQDRADGENVGNSYSHYLLSDLLRDRYGYDGVVCTDWGITGDPEKEIDSFGSRCYGVPEMTVAERHLRIILNGVDQFGGNNDMRPILDAWAIGEERYGKDFMRCRMEQSATRLLTGMFRLGLFENPYLDPEESARIVGSAELVRQGILAQARSLVLLKNEHQVLPLRRGLKVYIPCRHLRESRTFFRSVLPARDVRPLDTDLSEWMTRVDSPEEADVALVRMESPLTVGKGYLKEEREATGSGYLPIQLQYRPYTALEARQPSIAGGDFRENSADRSYRGKTSHAENEQDLDNLETVRKAMGNRPVIVCMTMHNPTVPAEWEPLADAVLLDFGVSARTLIDVLTGSLRPGGRLPYNLPRDMAAVEHHPEDQVEGPESYVTEKGECYCKGFGLAYDQTDGQAYQEPEA